MKLSSHPKIIISRTDNIGDVVLTLPMATVLKKKFPDCQILFLGKNYLKPLVDTCENIDVFLDWDEISAMPGNEGAKALKNTGAEVFIHVFPRPEIAQMAYKAGIKYRIGTSHRFYNWINCNKRVSFTRKDSLLHEAQLNFELLAPMGITDIPTVKWIGVNYGMTRIPALDDEWKRLFDKDRFNVIIHPLSRGSSRNWEWKNYNALVDIMSPKRFKIFVTGTEEESMKITENLLLYHPDVTDMTGKLSLTQLIAFISRADGIVAPSTGPLHIGAAFGNRAIGLYPSIKPMHAGRWAPLGPKAKYLSLIKDCIDCKNGGMCACINSIRPEQVKELLV